MFRIYLFIVLSIVLVLESVIFLRFVIIFSQSQDTGKSKTLPSDNQKILGKSRKKATGLHLTPVDEMIYCENI